MGEVVGAGLLAHVPTIVLPEEIRRELNNGQDTTLVAGLQQLRREVFDVARLRHRRRARLALGDHGRVRRHRAGAAAGPVHLRGAAARHVAASLRLPRRPRTGPPDRRRRPTPTAPGSPRSRTTTCRSSTRPRTCGSSSAQGCRTSAGSPSASARPRRPRTTCGSGRALGEAIAESDRKVLLIASGALSHTFWPLRELRDHEAAGVEHIFTPEAAAADFERIAWFKHGEHARVLETMPQFYRFKPEARFGHYLMMIGALGEGDCTATARQYGEYENSVGTGQVHLWFDRPESGFPPAAADRAGAARPRRSRSCTQPGSERAVSARPSTAGSCWTAPRSRSSGTATCSRRRRPRGRRRRRGAPAAGRSPPRSSLCTSTTSAGSTEFGTKLPAAPTYFHKPTSALNAHRGDVVRPDRCRWLNYEGEIAIVVGRTARNISPDEAGDYIAGYTIANDFGLHDFRDTDAGSMLRVKGSDTLCPLGPGLVTGWDFHGKGIRTFVNGEVRQDGNTDEMKWDMHYLVADIARTITLYPGDVLLSGTPANSRTVYPGDVVEVEVEGLGRLSNTIVAGPTPIRTDVGAQPTESDEVLSTAQGGDWPFRNDPDRLALRCARA